MIRNQKTEKAHRAVSEYIRPKLRPGVAFDATPFFIGVDDRNIADKIDDIVGAACRTTSGDLVHDAVVPELKRKLNEAVNEPDGTTVKGGEVDESIVDRILALLEHKLLPTELMAVRQILAQPSKKQRAASNDLEEVGEDARNARVAYAARWPNAAKIKREPSYAPAPTQQTPPDVAAYFARFPNAARIGR